MLNKEFLSPRWLEGRESTRIWQNKAKRFSTFLISAVDPRLGQSAGDSGEVAWLNGLRGFAAFLVYCSHHHQFTPHGDHHELWNAFGYHGEYYFGAFPFVRFFFAGGGRIAVALFFIISGFVLSYSPLRLIQARPDGADRQLATKIGTSFARRWLRLFLPVIVTTFAFMASWHLFHIQSGCFEATTPTPTFLGEAFRWLKEFIDGSYVFKTLGPFDGNHYNPHMWSIAVEYRGSIMVYVWVLSMFAIGYSPRARFWAALGLFTYLQFAVPGQQYACFIMGLLICDLTIVYELNPSQLPKLFRSEFFRKNTWIYYLIFLAGIYLGSIPHWGKVEELREQPGWFYLSHLVPPVSGDITWFYAAFGATLLVASIPQIWGLKRFFESGPIQYLGKISFGLYLIHGPILWTVGDRIYAAVGRPTPRIHERIPEWFNTLPISGKGPLGLEINAILPHFILLPLTLWAAGVVTNLVDTPSVKLSRYLFGARKTRDFEKSEAAKWELEGMLSQSEGRLPR